MSETTSLWALGIDFGGTKTALAAVSFPDLRIVRRATLVTPHRAGDTFLSIIEDQARQLIAGVTVEHGPCSAIGLGVCELVDRAGTLRSAVTVDWTGLVMAERFSGLAPVVIESDVRAAALAEAYAGAGATLDAFLYVNIGTGLSSAWVVGGVPWPGRHGNAILLGSSSLMAAGEPTVEALASGAGLAACYAGLTGQAPITAQEVLARAGSGENAAVAIMQHGAKALGTALAFAINLLDPDAVIFGGGMVGGQQHYATEIEAATRTRIYATASRDVPILRSHFAGDAAVIGAALKAYQSLGLSPLKPVAST